MILTKKLKLLLFLLIVPFLLISCKGPDGKFKLPGGDARKTPADPKKRIEQNLAEGKGFRLNNFGKNNSGVFEFASSNPLWRASINLLDFAPFSNVDYSGGIIITDWFSNENVENESLKITVKFLSNEIRADGINVIIHKKKCNNEGNCSVSKIESTLANEIKVAILKEATILKSKDPNPAKDYKMPEKIR